MLDLGHISLSFIRHFQIQMCFILKIIPSQLSFARYRSLQKFCGIEIPIVDHMDQTQRSYYTPKIRPLKTSGLSLCF